MFVRVSMPAWEDVVSEEGHQTLDTVCEESRQMLDVVVDAAEDEPLLFAAHSLGCLATVLWAHSASQEQLAKIKGALFVAVLDPVTVSFRSEVHDSANGLFAPLPFPSIVVASSNDPYSSIEFAKQCATAWGSRFEDIGPRGHINAASGLGDWEEGRRWLASLTG
jgi:predicted alpha/beta hydrolase family esterase